MAQETNESDSDSDSIDNPAIVIDSGSGMTKAGFAGQELPKDIFPTIIGKPFLWPVCVGVDLNRKYVGDYARSESGILELIYPIEHGVIQNWEYMQDIWHDCLYNQLRVQPEEHPILLTEPPLNPNGNKEKTAVIFFENFNAPSLAFGMTNVLACYSRGCDTGLSIEMGDGLISCVPIYEGIAVQPGISRMNMGGRDITEYLVKLLMERGYSYSTSAEKDIVCDIKVRLSYIVTDFETEIKTAETSAEMERNYELPDGQVITIGDERFRCGEILFQPKELLEMDHEGIHHMARDSILKCSVDIREQLVSNILLSGGCSMMPQMCTRFGAEMSKLFADNKGIQIEAALGREYRVWIGGSMLASLANKSWWIEKKVYEEHGPNVVHRYCT